MRAPFASPADHAACRALLRGGSRSFAAAARLLPYRVAGPATSLFAFCRVADDAVDLRRERADALRGRLDDVYRGRPADHPADRALADVVIAHDLPAALPRALIEGFAWDEAGRRYETLADLHDYAARVAGSVGTMMAWLMGVRDPAMLARACELGIAMQLTNIARDVGEDARAGRLYLPLAWLDEAGIDPDAWSRAPGAAALPVVRRLLAEAARLYAGADAAVAALPWECRLGIGAARALYAGIGDEVVRLGDDAVRRRAVVPRWRKAALVARALGRVIGTAPDVARRPVVPAGAFLIDAARGAATRPGPSRIAGRGWTWVVDLFLRLDERTQPRSA